MIRGGCLCGAVRFEISQAFGPFELCHCNRCRKVSGSAFMAGLGVRRDNFTWISGENIITTYDAAIIESPPAYRVCFCSICGSCVPDPAVESGWLEVAAGLLDDDPILRPDKHIFVEHKADWYQITDQLPQYDKMTLIKHRRENAD